MIPVRRCRRPAAAIEPLEPRALLAAAVHETESNNAIGSANAVPVSPGGVTVVSGTLGGQDVDYFTFTLASRSGVFFDTDARETGLAATLDTRITLYNAAGTTPLGENEDGRDFDTLVLRETSVTPRAFGDSAFYADLPAGAYAIRLSSWGGPVEPYELRITADSGFTAQVAVFSSLPGAADTLYLDFDGHAATDAWGAYDVPAYDLNGNAAEWTPGERMAIENAFRVVADAFAPFNINVTTAPPAAGAFASDGVAYRQVIGNSNGSAVAGVPAGTRGVAWLDGYNSGGPTRKTGFTFAQSIFDTFLDSGPSGDIVAGGIEIGNESVKQIAVAMGLEPYTDDAQKGALLYAQDFGLNRARWSSGTNAQGAAQDDVATIAGAANTFGYRADDHGNARAAASVLAAAGDRYAAGGVIHQTSDVDFFRFNGAGATTVAIEVPEHLARLDGEIYLYDAAGGLIASNEIDDRLGAAVSVTLPSAGAYFVEVRSDGGPGEIGGYGLSIGTIVPDAGGGSIAGRTFRDINYNGLYEPAAGETALGGVAVYLDADADGALDAGEATVTSSVADGSYAFRSVPVGTYTVRQAAPPTGYASDAAHPRAITAAGESYAGVDLGNFPLAFAGTGGDDSFTLRLKSGDATRVEIVDPAGRAHHAPKSLVTSLHFSGGAGNDLLTVSYANGNPVPAGGVIYDGGAHAGAPFDRLVVDGSNTADQFFLNSAAGAPGVGAIAVAGVEAVTVNGGVGIDTLTTGSGFGGATTFDGGSARDVLVITGTGSNDAVNVTAAAVTSVHGSIAYTTTEEITLNTLGGFDTVSVASIPSLVWVTVNAGDGNDTLLWNNTANFSGSLTFNGEAHTDAIVRTARPTGDRFSVSDFVLYGYGGSMHHTSTEAITINGGAGADEFNANTFGANGPDVTINGGGGNDKFVLGGNLEHLQTDLTVDGGAGTDALTVHDGGSTTHHGYRITESTLDSTAPGFGSIAYFAMETFKLEGGWGNNGIVLTGTAPGTTTIVRGGLGADALYIAGTPASPTAVQYNGGSDGELDQLFVNAGTYTFDTDVFFDPLSITVGEAGTVVFNTSQRPPELHVNGRAVMSPHGGQFLRPGVLTIGPAGRLDLKDNDLIIASAPGQTIEQLSQWIRRGFTGGDGDIWSGAGLVTTMPDAMNSVSMLGVAAAADIYGLEPGQTHAYAGQTVGAGDVIVKYTFAGDANLDGFVDGGDYAYIDVYVGSTGADVSYLHGDFNYDGYIDGGDYAYIDVNVNRPGQPL